MKTTMYAIIKKDFRGLAANRRLFIALLIVPVNGQDERRICTRR